MTIEEQIKSVIATVPDYPKPGIQFRDISPLLADAASLRLTIDTLVDRYQHAGLTQVVGIEARGFIFGTALAYALGVGFVTLRKPGKLPRETYSQEYQLEYGTDALEIHQDALQADDKVVIVDDLLATGGTVLAAVKLVENSRATLHECCFVVGLNDLPGRALLTGKQIPHYTLCSF